MSYNEKSKAYVAKYKASNIKRVPLDMQITEYETLKAAADAVNEKVNQYIKAAIRQRIERENAGE